jgi:hypothetical protein
MFANPRLNGPGLAPVRLKLRTALKSAQAQPALAAAQAKRDRKKAKRVEIASRSERLSGNQLTMHRFSL